MMTEPKCPVGQPLGVSHGTVLRTRSSDSVSNKAECPMGHSLGTVPWDSTETPGQVGQAGHLGQRDDCP